MKKWKKVSNFAGGVIYASGNERKIVLPNCRDIYFTLDNQAVRWHPDRGGNNPTIIKGKKQ
ncbi:MAG: hypothetical protein PVJ08_07440 [Dehalococcoidia bacterium]|jgi:hypothetical protein